MECSFKKYEYDFMVVDNIIIGYKTYYKKKPQNK